jgi:hypothetical protein
LTYQEKCTEEGAVTAFEKNNVYSDLFQKAVSNNLGKASHLANYTAYHLREKLKMKSIEVDKHVMTDYHVAANNFIRAFNHGAFAEAPKFFKASITKAFSAKMRLVVARPQIAFLPWYVRHAELYPGQAEDEEQKENERGEVVPPKLQLSIDLALDDEEEEELSSELLETPKKNTMTLTDRTP